MLTPSSLDYLTMTLDDLVVCDLDGNVVEGDRSPTTEKTLHLGAAQATDDINAIMHCHAKHCTMFALTRQPIPAVIEEFVVYVGGDVPVADYQTTGTDDLAEEVAERVADRGAVLMANHGLFAVGKDPQDALHIANLVERTAEIVWGARRLGEIVPLPEADQQAVRRSTTATAAPGSSDRCHATRDDSSRHRCVANSSCSSGQRLRSRVRPSPSWGA